MRLVLLIVFAFFGLSLGLFCVADENTPYLIDIDSQLADFIKPELVRIRESLTFWLVMACGLLAALCAVQRPWWLCAVFFLGLSPVRANAQGSGEGAEEVQQGLGIDYDDGGQSGWRVYQKPGNVWYMDQKPRTWDGTPGIADYVGGNAWQVYDGGADLWDGSGMNEAPAPWAPPDYDLGVPQQAKLVAVDKALVGDGTNWLSVYRDSQNHAVWLDDEGRSVFKTLGTEGEGPRSVFKSRTGIGLGEMIGDAYGETESESVPVGYLNVQLAGHTPVPEDTPDDETYDPTDLDNDATFQDYAEALNVMDADPESVAEDAADEVEEMKLYSNQIQTKIAQMPSTFEGVWSALVDFAWPQLPSGTVISLNFGSKLGVVTINSDTHFAAARVACHTTMVFVAWITAVFGVYRMISDMAGTN